MREKLHFPTDSPKARSPRSLLRRHESTSPPDLPSHSDSHAGQTRLEPVVTGSGASEPETPVPATDDFQPALLPRSRPTPTKRHPKL